LEAVARGEGEHLEQALGLPEVPLILFDNSRADRNAKATQQPDPHGFKLPY
jgi:hypothetical protein